MTQHNAAGRRVFLKRMAHLGLAGMAVPFAANLAAIGEAAAFNADDGYKALVCIFLNGGNDNGNTIVPVDSQGYNDYTQLRDSLALPRSALTAALNATPLAGGRQYALPLELRDLVPIYNEGRLGIHLNVGPLIQPTSVQEYLNGSVPLPPKLYSHNDQTSVWQSSRAEGSLQGWGGNLGDLAMASNGGSASFTCMSVTGNAVFMAGANVLPYRVGTNGADPIELLTQWGCGQNGSCGNTLRTLITEPRTNIFENEINAVYQRSINAQGIISNVLDGTTASQAPFAALGGNSLADQLKMVARLIEGRSRYLAEPRRQVFMVSLGGFDTHDDLIGTHRNLLSKLGPAMAAFHQAMKNLGLSNQVTTFTASEFGRTLSSNGNGSDHGWGGHQFIMGGAVDGGAFYGTPPTTRLGTGEDVGRGVLLPTTAVDQFAATLALWFGATRSELPLILPNYPNFDAGPSFMRGFGGNGLRRRVG